MECGVSQNFKSPPCTHIPPFPAPWDFTPPNRIRIAGCSRLTFPHPLMGQKPSSPPGEASPSLANQLKCLPSITSILRESCTFLLFCVYLFALGPYPDFTPVDFVPTPPSECIDDEKCQAEAPPATPDSAAHSRLREELRHRIASTHESLDLTKNDFEKHPWFPKPPPFKAPDSLPATNQAPDPSHLNPTESRLATDASIHTASIHKMVDALYQPFRKILPFSLLSEVAWLLSFHELYPVASPEFLIFEIDFLSRDVAGFANTFGFAKPNQALFFTILELIRLVIASSHKDVEWKSIDMSLSNTLAGWKHEVRNSKGITARYIAKIQKYIVVELLPANLTRTMLALTEWDHALTTKPRPPPSAILLPRRDRLEIFYAMSSNASKSHFQAMEQIVTVYIPTLVASGACNGLQVLQKLMYLMRQFVFLLARSPDRHKHTSKTKVFLDAMGDIAELAVTVWSVIGPQTSASELLWMVEIMDGIDTKLAKSGFVDGVFGKAKIKIMLWCCKQEWFQKSLGERHPDWHELGKL